jgi:ferredoxin-type protein NapF
MERRELFSFLSSSIQGDVKGKKQRIIRPPYYDDKDAFDKECHKCDGKCASFCQEQIIVIAEDKTPFLDFSEGGCTYCDECANVCEYDVLFLQNKHTIDANVTIDEKSCLSWQGVMCFSCKDPCLEDAIEFQAMFMPHIDEQKCTSCGFCISRCPSASITIS